MSRRRCLLALALSCTLLAVAGSAAAQRLTMVRALARQGLAANPQFVLRVDSQQRSGSVVGLFVMPGADLQLQPERVPANADMQLETHGFGHPVRLRAGGWRWRAPRQPGLYPITLSNRATGGRMRLNVFVKTPFDAATDQLNGYAIGRYQPVARSRDPRSGPPRALIEVTPGTASVWVSPHFTLGDFLCHQQPEHWPKYLLIRTALLQKLERIRSALLAAGVNGNAIVVMSGYRTPWYNADIGNTTVYSQHLFGSAADIYVDADNDGDMDDLDADGAVTVADARWLADLVAAVTATRPALAGGLSAYPGNAYHGPFVHVDVRGTAVRW